MKKYIKSCMNYTGGKYKLLNQIIPLFPKNIDKFVDLFCGGCNVGINVESDKKIFNDSQEQLISLYSTIQGNSIDELLFKIEYIINKYGLSNTYLYGYSKYDSDSSKGLGKYNKNKYLDLRNEYNRVIKQSNQDEILRDMLLYTLIIFGFNNQLRFNKKKEFNTPVGKRDFNANIRKNLIDFKKKISQNDIKFTCKDFRKFNFNTLNNKDFVYLDPPYLITTASYNEQGGWTEVHEKDLLNLLDELNNRNIKFALSNVLESKGKENRILKEWSYKYNINHLNYNYNNSNYQLKNKTQKTLEVLITNY